MKYRYLPIIFLSFCITWLPTAHALSNHAATLEKELFSVCDQYRAKVAFAKTYQPGVHKTHPLEPSFDEKAYSLAYLVNLFDYQLSEKQTDVLFKKLDAQQCVQVLRDFSISFEEQVENKAIRDFYAYYKTHPIEKLSLHSTPEEKFAKLEKMMGSVEGFKFPFLEDYFHLVAKPLALLSIQPHRNFNLENRLKIEVSDLKNQYVTFVGAGFPLSGIIVNLLTGAKVNLIDIDKNALKQAKRFLIILDKAGVVKLSDFTLKLADGQDLFYAKQRASGQHIKTDILYLAAALPSDVKQRIFQKIRMSKNKDLTIIDRYVSGVYKILYYHKVPDSALSAFEVLAKIYPRNLYVRKLKENTLKVKLSQNDTKFVDCSTRILKLR